MSGKVDQMLEEVLNFCTLFLSRAWSYHLLFLPLKRCYPINGGKLGDGRSIPDTLMRYIPNVNSSFEKRIFCSFFKFWGLQSKEETFLMDGLPLASAQYLTQAGGHWREQKNTAKHNWVDQQCHFRFGSHKPPISKARYSNLKLSMDFSLFQMN